ncbi:cytochrome P450 [Xylogone sp. PMI_703]|nr:cytochrome P450 [Xylogone sp. PMI_703]
MIQGLFPASVDKNSLILIGVISCLLFYTILYVLYQRFFHPLAKYPGPFFATLTDLGRFNYFYSLKIDQILFELHRKYGPIVRYGPNDLSFWEGKAVVKIYKAGRSMPKSAFYNGFTVFKPNMFGTTDETIHALRKRQVAHNFSIASLTDMEEIFDRHIINLLSKLQKHVDSHSPVDLKLVFAFFVFDFLGDIAFSTQFDTQKEDDPSNLPPIGDHFLLSSLYGCFPSLLPYSAKVVPYIPMTWLQKLAFARKQMRHIATDAVSKEIAESKLGKERSHKDTNLLTRLVEAKDPETGQALSETDIQSEAWLYLIAGSHTTSSTLTLLFFHLLHNPNIYDKVVTEIDRELQPLDATRIYQYTGLESKLPYTLACIRENFRASPSFTMPLARVITNPEGLEILGERIPTGTNCAVSSYPLHHNPSIWGSDHDVFRPERWLGDEYSKDQLDSLLHFGMGHRSCIGRNIAMISIIKVVSTVLRHFRLDAMDRDEVLEMETTGVSDKKGPLWCKVSSRE